MKWGGGNKLGEYPNLCNKENLMICHFVVDIALWYGGVYKRPTTIISVAIGLHSLVGIALQECKWVYIGQFLSRAPYSGGPKAIAA